MYFLFNLKIKNKKIIYLYKSNAKPAVQIIIKTAQKNKRSSETLLSLLIVFLKRFRYIVD